MCIRDRRYRILQRSQPYEVGEVLICRSWFKARRVVFHVNYEYNITKVADDTVTLGNGSELPIGVIQKLRTQLLPDLP